MSSSVQADRGCFPSLYSAIVPAALSLKDSISQSVSNIFYPKASPEEAFYEAVKNLSEEEIVKYVQEGHRPPPGQALKIRKKGRIQSTDEVERSTQLEQSIVVLASGTVFRTGKRNELSGHPSVPGGNESKLLGEGKRKRAFLVKDLNTGRNLAITVSKQKNGSCLPEMKKEVSITNRIASPLILQVHAYSRTTRCMNMNIQTGYLESEVCDGGTLEERPELVRDPAIQAQVRQAVQDIHRFGYVHMDIHRGNIGLVQHPNKSMSVRFLDFGNAQRLYPNDRMGEVDLIFMERMFSSAETT